MRSSLKGILDYESGDSWHGTHFRSISVRFNEGAQTVTVESQNSYCALDTYSRDFDLVEAKRQLDAGELKGAKHLDVFSAAMNQIAQSRAL